MQSFVKGFVSLRCCFCLLLHPHGSQIRKSEAPKSRLPFCRVYLSWIEKKRVNRKQKNSSAFLWRIANIFPFVSKLYLGGEGYCYYFKWKIRSCKQMPRAFLSTSSLSVSLKKKMTRKANSKDAFAPLGLLYMTTVVTDCCCCCCSCLIWSSTKKIATAGETECA